MSEIAAPSRTAEPSGESGHALDQMTYRFALDKDADVRSFVMSFVDPDILEKQREKEMKAAIQMAEASIEERAAEREQQEDEDIEDVDTDEEEEEESKQEDEDQVMSEAHADEKI